MRVSISDKCQGHARCKALAPELFDRDLRIDPISEPFHRETFVTELAVEGLVGSILPIQPALVHGPAHPARAVQPPLSPRAQRA